MECQTCKHRRQEEHKRNHPNFKINVMEWCCTMILKKNNRSKQFGAFNKTGGKVGFLLQCACSMPVQRLWRPWRFTWTADGAAAVVRGAGVALTSYFTAAVSARGERHPSSSAACVLFSGYTSAAAAGLKKSSARRTHTEACSGGFIFS